MGSLLLLCWEVRRIICIENHPLLWGHFFVVLGSSALKRKEKKKTRTPSFMGCCTPLVMKCVQNCKKTAQNENFLLTKAQGGLIQTMRILPLVMRRRKMDCRVIPVPVLTKWTRDWNCRGGIEGEALGIWTQDTCWPENAENVQLVSDLQTSFGCVFWGVVF